MAVNKNIELARQLRLLVEQHKEECNSPDCGISTSSFAELYQELLGRKLTQGEWVVFF